MISPNLSKAVALLVLCTCGARAQSGKAPAVTMSPVAPVAAEPGKPAQVPLNFRVAQGFHINSNTPKDEFLIPTALKMDLASGIVVGKIEYPAGQDVNFPFSPDSKLNVYSGDFTINLVLHPSTAVVPGSYAVHGVLRYQACDNAQCFPPKTLPVTFEVKVGKEPATPRHNPGQGPHGHG